MIRFVLRSFSVVFLAFAVIFAILDGARSVGASQWAVKPLLSIWTENAPETLDAVQAFVMRHVGAGVWNTLCIPFFEQPGWVVFGALAFLFYALAYRRRRPDYDFGASE